MTAHHPGARPGDSLPTPCAASGEFFPRRSVTVRPDTPGPPHARDTIMPVPALNRALSFRRYRAAFFFVVTLLAAVTAFTLWNELRTNARIDELFGAALEREALI